MIRVFQEFVPRRKLMLVASECLLLSGIVLTGTCFPGLATRPLGEATPYELWRGALSALAIAVLCQISLSFNDLYDWRVSRNRRDLPNRLLHATGFGLITLALLVFLLPGSFYFPCLPNLHGQTWKLVLTLAVAFALVVVPIILDGENAWEHYKNDGRDFFLHLYERLSGEERLKTITVSDYINTLHRGDQLERLYPGSWINANYGIWIGHEEDNLSWDYLTEAREALEQYQQANPDLTLEKAWKSIHIAEGSDWNWWYGDEHSTETEEDFDELFRLNLMQVYKEIGNDVPPHLFVPVLRHDRGISPALAIRGFIKPKIDGVVTSYYEWYQGAQIDAKKSGGSMHKSASLVSSVYYGFNEDHLFIRIDPAAAFDALEDDVEIVIITSKPADWMGHAAPFAFDTRYAPAPGVARLLCGTPPILSLAALECGVALLARAGVEPLRRKSLALTDLFIRLAEQECGGFGFTLASPRPAARRGSQVSLRHPEGYAIVQALIARGVVGDFRAPDVLRFGFAPAYLRFVDVWDAVAALRAVMQAREWRRDEHRRQAKVT